MTAPRTTAFKSCCYGHHDNRLQRDVQVSHEDRPSQRAPTTTSPGSFPQALLLSCASQTLQTACFKHRRHRSPSVCLTCLSVRLQASEDDGSGSREGPLTTQPVSEDHPGGGDREGREHSEQVIALIIHFSFFSEFASSPSPRN